jgi:hypothetical protein
MTRACADVAEAGDTVGPMSEIDTAEAGDVGLASEAKNLGPMSEVDTAETGDTGLASMAE